MSAIAADDEAVPAVLAELVAGRSARCVWRNQLGGLTVAIGEPVVEYVKWSPEHWEVDLGLEAEKASWAAEWVTAPTVLGVGAGVDRVLGPGSWLHTRALPGTSAIEPRWQSEACITELGRGLRHWHDTLPVRECAWSWRAEDRIGVLAEHLPGPWLEAVRDVPDGEAEVVCHGDACNPNFLMSPDDRDPTQPRGTGYVDLGQLGLGDRWADLAPALLSLGWNFADPADPARRQALFLHGYRVDLDADRLAYYTRLWQAGDAGS